MKKIYIYASAALLLIAGGCKKELDQKPHNAIPYENTFKTPEDYTYAISGAYVALRSSVYYGGQDNGGMISTPDILADNLILNQSGRKSQSRFFNYKYVASNTWDIWGDAYKTILRTNFVLENLNKLPEDEFRDNIEAEALAIRALAHFDLLRVYAKSYTSATDADPGIPFVTSTDYTLLPSRTPLKQTYNLVLADLVKAEGLIAADNPVGHFTKPAIEGLLSRIYLYMGDWQKSADAANRTITNVDGKNDLADTTSFADIWLDKTEKDVLLKLKNLDADNDPIGVGYKQGSPNGVIPEYSVDFAFYNLFQDEDVRKAAYIDKSNYNETDYYYVYKYNGREAGDADVVDVKLIRMGEVYLNLAEAEYNLGKQGDALTALNKLRSNRYTNFDPATANETGTALYNAILLQRRLELAFEGSRFFDLKRLNLPVQRSNFGDEADGAGIPASVKTVAAKDKLFQLPIPQAEINANKNISQNTGY
ncbi:RagB/SusD family nutrient uptake outer membrane protein [Mucilaginibacter gynuensis]|uniref:RagB/SusD family nutrient uptake outer membrane protein n=1 Tax=Mucilaginibacter gynuensis TaxID=1302236 RepID=A0ABP8G0G1_9SPHI